MHENSRYIGIPPASLYLGRMTLGDERHLPHKSPVSSLRMKLFCATPMMSHTPGWW